MVVFENQTLKLVPSVLFQNTKCFLSYTSSFSGNETIARRVFRLKPPKIHWETNLYTFTQQVGRRNAGDDVKMRENVIDCKPLCDILREGREKKLLL